MPSAYPVFVPLKITSPDPRERRLMPIYLAQSERPFRTVDAPIMLSATDCNRASEDTGSRTPVTGIRDNSVRSTWIRCSAWSVDMASGANAATCRINSRTSGVIASVQHVEGS